MMAAVLEATAMRWLALPSSLEPILHLGKPWHLLWFRAPAQPHTTSARAQLCGMAELLPVANSSIRLASLRQPSAWLAFVNLLAGL